MVIRFRTPIYILLKVLVVVTIAALGVFAQIGVTELEVVNAKNDWGPYLSWTDDPKTTMTITWVTNEKIKTYIEWWEDGGSKQTFENLTLTDVHSVKLSGLAPGKTYHYRVLLSDGMSPEYEFRTEPEDPESFTFAVYGDNRLGFNGLGEICMHFFVAKRVLKENPDFVINVGDIVVVGDDIPNWGRFFHEIRELAATRPYFVAIGNHEMYHEPTANPQHFLKYFTFPGNELYYSFDYGNAHFVILNISFIPWDHYVNPTQIQWLKNDLEDAKSRGVKWIFVFFHVPPFSSVVLRELIIENYVPIFENYSVTAVFSGHEHYYDHIIHNGIHYFVTGGGGAELTEKLKLDLNESVYRESVFHYCLVSVYDDHVVVEMKRLDGTIGERTVIGEPYQERLPEIPPFWGNTFRVFAIIGAILVVVSHKKDEEESLLLRRIFMPILVISIVVLLITLAQFYKFFYLGSPLVYVEAFVIGIAVISFALLKVMKYIDLVDIINIAIIAALFIGGTIFINYYFERFPVDGVIAGSGTISLLTAPALSELARREKLKNKVLLDVRSKFSRKLYRVIEYALGVLGVIIGGISPLCLGPISAVLMLL